MVRPRPNMARPGPARGSNPNIFSTEVTTPTCPRKPPFKLCPSSCLLRCAPFQLCFASSWPRSAQDGRKLALRWLTLPPSCLQDGSRWHDDGKMAARSPKDGAKTPQDRNLSPTWAQLDPTRPHLGLVFRATMNISHGSGCMFEGFAVMRLKKLKMASRWPKMASRWPKMASRWLKWSLLLREVRAIQV